jgi:hypothetical protein
MSVPEGLAKCAVCGEYRGKVRAGDLGLGTRPVSPEDSDGLLGVSCVCEGIECVLCLENKTHRPISNIYDERTNDICHVPHFSVLCGECKARRSAEAAARERTEPVPVEPEVSGDQVDAQLIVLRPLVSCNGVLERAVAGGSLVYGISPALNGSY